MDRLALARRALAFAVALERALRDRRNPGAIMQFDRDQFAGTLVAGMPDAIIYADADGNILFWNAGAARMFGFSESEAVGKSLDIIVPDGLRDRHWSGYRNTMRTGQTQYDDGQVLSVPAKRKDGTRLSVEFTIVPFADDAGQMIGIAAVMRNTTA